MFHFFNCLGVKNDFNQHSETSFEDADFYISNHMKEISPSSILVFGLCASLREDSAKNMIFLPSSLNYMCPRGKLLQVFSKDLLTIKDNKNLRFENMFEEIKNIIPIKVNELNQIL
jgi:hypothetical protein